MANFSYRYIGSCKMPSREHFLKQIFLISSLLKEMEEIEMLHFHAARRRVLKVTALNPFASKWSSFFIFPHDGAKGSRHTRMTSRLFFPFFLLFLFCCGAHIQGWHLTLVGLRKSRAMVGDIAGSTFYIETFVHVTLTLAEAGLRWDHDGFCLKFQLFSHCA